MSAPPFGFTYEAGELVRDEHEQTTLQTMRDMREEGSSYAHIAGVLNARGDLHRGRFWNPQTVWYLLTKESGE